MPVCVVCVLCVLCVLCCVQSLCALHTCVLCVVCELLCVCFALVGLHIFLVDVVLFFLVFHSFLGPRTIATIIKSLT